MVDLDLVHSIKQQNEMLSLRLAEVRRASEAVRQFPGNVAVQEQLDSAMSAAKATGGEVMSLLNKLMGG